MFEPAFAEGDSATVYDAAGNVVSTLPTAPHLARRWVIERGFSWLHQFKRLRTRYEVRADRHLGLMGPACALICWRRLLVILKRG